MSHVVGSGDSTAALDHLFDVWEVAHAPGLDFETKVERLFELETEAFGLPYAFLTRAEPAADTQTIEVAAGDHELLQRGERGPLSESYCRKTIADSDGVFHVDDARAEGWADDPAFERFQLGTYVGARVEVDEETFGTFCFASSAPRGEPLTAEERQLVDLLATWVSDQLTARRRARDPSDEVEELVRTVTHDLRSPLSVAQGRVRLLEESMREAVDEVQTAHERMDTIIERLLVLARVDQPVTDPVTVDLDGCARTAWDMVPTGDARLDISCESTRIVADRGRLGSLFENLFRNSVEHGSTSSRVGPADSVERGSTDNRTAEPTKETEGTGGTADEVAVEVGLLADGNGFYVADDGRGIPPAEREVVFDPGYSGATDGTGFGLSIVERIADAHGWRVRATRSGAGGARFEFTGVEFVPADG
jgi:signal transduction histidine kinase